MAINEAKILITASDLTRAAFDSAKSGLEKLQNSSAAVTGAVGALTGGLAALGATISVGAFGQMTKNVLDLQDNLFKMSQRTGVAVEELSTLRYAADLSGVGVEDLDGLLVKLNKTLAAAGTGDKTAVEFLKQFNISAEEAKSGSINAAEAVKRMAERFANSPDGLNKSTVALDAFSKSGAKGIAFLNLGREGIEALQSEAEKLGLKLSTETARGAEELNDQLRTLEFYSEGLRTSFVNSLVPSISAIVKEMKDATIEGGKFAGIMKGLQTFLTGNDQYKNDKALVELTERKFQIENDIAAARARNNGVRVLTFSAELAKVEAELKTTMAYRAQLELVKNAEVEAGKAREAAKKTGSQMTPRAGLQPEKAPTAERVAEIDRLIQSMRERNTVLEAELNAEEKLTEAQKRAVTIMTQLRDGKLTGSVEQRQALAVALEAELSNDRANEQRKIAIRQLEEENKLLADRNKEALEAADDLEKEVNSQRLANEEIGLTREQLLVLRDARMADAIAAREQTLASLEKTSASASEIEATKEQVEALRKLRTLQNESATKEIAVEAAKKAEEEWKRTADNINHSLTDALLRGFESGKDSAKNLRDTMSNMFRTLVLRPMIEAQMKPIAQLASQTIGNYGGGGLLGQLGGLFGGGNSGYNFTNSAGFADVGLGFANGGSFMVGGSGGTDSQMVAFRASPDERVTIETPGQRSAAGGGGGAPTFIFNQTINPAPGNDRNALVAVAAQIKSDTIREVSARLSTRGFRAEGAALA